MSCQVAAAACSTAANVALRLNPINISYRLLSPCVQTLRHQDCIDSASWFPALMARHPGTSMRYTTCY